MEVEQLDNFLEQTEEEEGNCPSAANAAEEPQKLGRKICNFLSDARRDDGAMRAEERTAAMDSIIAIFLPH